MTTLNTYVIRGEVLESCHEAKSVIKDFNFSTLLTTQNEGDLTFPRSSIKVFQAIPFILSNAHIKFSLNQKNIAISCASHAGENQHLIILKKWIKNIDLKINKLLCGSHNPINLQSSNNLLLSGVLPNQLHNNCSGKHLGMISGCLARKIQIDNYVDYLKIFYIICLYLQATNKLNNRRSTNVQTHFPINYIFRAYQCPVF